MSGAIPVGTLPDGRPVRGVVLDNGILRATLWDHGARLHDLRLRGHAPGLVLGLRDPGGTTPLLATFGAVLGPVANRIRNARFGIDGRDYAVEAGTDGHCLHSGAAGLHLKTWELVETVADSASFALDLAHGEGGFPGARYVRARYALDGAALRLDLTARTDRPTPMNLAHHPYWTMQDPLSWAGQELWIDAAHYLPVDGATIPTGEIAPVAGTEFDFRVPRRLDPAAVPALDHNFCLSRAPRPLVPALRLASAATGTQLEVATTAPGLQVFDMHPFGIAEEETLHGHPYPRRAALAVEPQMWPDAPGRPDWPGIVLRPGSRWRMAIEYRLAGPAAQAR